MKSVSENSLVEVETRNNDSCPGCGSAHIKVFYEARELPVHSVLLMPTREEALSYPKGDIELGFCRGCGFISNVAFDPTSHEYSGDCEETQAFSDTFNIFHRRLASRLIERYDLSRKSIIEIGCGKGEFLTLLCDMGDNSGIGFDPAYVSERNKSSLGDRVNFIKDFYSEKYASYQADFVCCKMTLEHIHNTKDFLGVVRRSIGDRADTIVFFQVPDVMRILREQAFWDIYYEHCSYFSAGSLARLFRDCGFEVLDLWRDYDDQYLGIEARPMEKGPCPRHPQEEDIEELERIVSHFSEQCRRRIDGWREEVRRLSETGKRIVIWGGGSKGVAFLTTLGIRDEIEYAVDIDPYKNGTYIAGTGQRIVSPDFLRDYRPDIVIVMNPIYCEEIRRDLASLGLTPDMLAL